MTYREKKSLYESIMMNVARIVKRHINESDSDDFKYKEIEILKEILLENLKKKNTDCVPIEEYFLCVKIMYTDYEHDEYPVYLQVNNVELIDDDIIFKCTNDNWDVNDDNSEICIEDEEVDPLDVLEADDAIEILKVAIKKVSKY